MPEMSATQFLDAETPLPEPVLPGADPHALQTTAPETPVDEELSRLEALLYARTQHGRELARELARCDRLLREALERIPSLASSELQALRRGYDAAVERAIEAEVGRAELTFALDETRTQLTAAPTPWSSGAVVGQKAAAPGVYARVAQLEEAEGNLHARLVLAEQDREGSQQRVKELTRELLELNERAELLLSRERALQGALDQRTQREHVLRAEQRGVSARADETELAFKSAYARMQQLDQRASDAKARVAEARAEAAERLVLVQAHAARIEELQRALGLEQQEVRSLRAQVAATVSAQQQQTAAREADEAQWAERVRDLAEREQSSAATVVSSDTKLRALLSNLKKPLHELDASLDQLGPNARVLQVAEALHSEATEPGTAYGAANDPSLVEQLRVRERQVAELEAALARYGQSPSTVGLAAPGARTEVMRLTDELARERTRRRRLGVTVRALQAASETGEAIDPWIQELVTILSEGVSLRPGSK
jgi:chromosome segregation ATPase